MTAAATTAARRLVIGGVPEHFNVPLMRAIDQGVFARHGLDVSFKVCHGGTGEQIKLLASGELDCCVALTEGLVSGLVSQPALANAPYRLLGTWVQSPLTWAVAVHPTSNLTLSTLRGAKIGISRYHSGSHLIPYLHAIRHAWIDADLPPFEFTVCKDFATLRSSIADRSIDAFLWEVATTQRYFDDATLKHIGNVVPHWPAFSVAVSACAASSGAAVLAGLSDALSDWATLDDAAKIDAVTAALPAYARKDVTSWLGGVRFQPPTRVASVDRAALREIVEMLVSGGVVTRAPEVAWTEFVARECGTVVE
ncbi:hypothetical protein GGF32_004907 [Allomyces javanicus]|nr:hypothetical protein GGF32_004907 [Allomyces javanicus]